MSLACTGRWWHCTPWRVLSQEPALLDDDQDIHPLEPTHKHHQACAFLLWQLRLRQKMRNFRYHGRDTKKKRRSILDLIVIHVDLFRTRNLLPWLYPKKQGPTGVRLFEDSPLPISGTRLGLYLSAVLQSHLQSWVISFWVPSKRPRQSSNALFLVLQLSVKNGDDF